MKEKIDQCKLPWHAARVMAYRLGERVAPITVDLAITRACTFKCAYCYGNLQKQPGTRAWTEKMIMDTFDDFADIGVKAVSFVSDGESTCHPLWVEAIEHAAACGLDVALGTNGYLCDEEALRRVLPHLTYLRFNVTGAMSKRYQEIHGVDSDVYETVLDNIRTATALNRLHGYDVTIGMQAVFLPSYVDQLFPLCGLAKGLDVQYLVIKHCSDDEAGSLGVKYQDYEMVEEHLQRAESMSDDLLKIVVKWRKIRAGNKREYTRCLAPPLQLQISGSGLVAPCGMFFAPKYFRYHMGNLHDSTFKEIWSSDRYWEVMEHLGSCRFNAQKECGCLCLQDASNIYLDTIWDSDEALQTPPGDAPGHLNFV